MNRFTTFYRRTGKRAFDVLGACVMGIVVFPLIATIAVIVRRLYGPPAFFRQQRPGLNGKLFTMKKIRTMTEAQSEGGDLLPDEQRLTRLGRILRQLSVDELPTLWNVLVGDMSLVGPRPLLPRYLGRYTDHQARRHEVRPGITGWAQIHGRNLVSWDTRLDYDVWYVDNLTFRLDVAILMRTVVQVVAQRGISAEGHSTMPEFQAVAERPESASAPAANEPIKK